MTWTVNGTTTPSTPTTPGFVSPVTAQDPSGVAAQVTQGWGSAQNYASTAFTSAQTFLSQLSSAASSTAVPSVNTAFALLNLDISAFNSLLGTAPPYPANSFAFTEIPYSSNLLTDLRAALLQWVDGKSTGLLPSVEQAIWDRGRSREMATFRLKSNTAIRSFAMRGFSKPPGALSLELQDAAQETQNTAASLSRDVMIKQAELEQANRRFSLEQAGKMEEALIAYTNQQMQRALETAKTMQQFVLDIYGHEVTAYGVTTQAYAARVGAETQAFRAKSDMQVADANVRIEDAKVRLQAFIQQLTLQVETVKAGAQVAGQLAASALSSISVHGSMSTAVSNAASNSTSQAASASSSTQVSMGSNYNWSGAAA